MADNQNTLINYQDIDAKRTGTGSTQLPGGWTKHAPKGGIVIAGKRFKGGQFIPEADLENASPEELQKLTQAINNSAREKEGLGKAQQNQLKPLGESQVTQEMVPNQVLKQHVYLLDDGELLGRKTNLFGYFVIKNNIEKDLEILEGDLVLLSSFNTRRVDFLLADHVISIVNNGSWPAAHANLSQNITQHILKLPSLSIEQIPYSSYAPAGLLPESFLNSIGINLKQQLSLKNPAEGGVIRLCACEKDIDHKILTHNLWKLLGIKKGTISKNFLGGIPITLEDKELIAKDAEKNSAADLFMNNTDPDRLFNEYADLNQNNLEETSKLIQPGIEETKTVVEKLTGDNLDDIVKDGELVNKIKDRITTLKKILEKLEYSK